MSLQGCVPASLLPLAQLLLQRPLAPLQFPERIWERRLRGEAGLLRPSLLQLWSAHSVGTEGGHSWVAVEVEVVSCQT